MNSADLKTLRRALEAGLEAVAQLEAVDAGGDGLARKKPGEGCVNRLPSGRWRVRVRRNGHATTQVFDTREQAEQARVLMVDDVRGRKLAHHDDVLSLAYTKDAMAHGTLSVYFIRTGFKTMKIGFAADVKARLSGLQTGSSKTLTLVATIPGGALTEGIVHEHLRHHRLDGEWFALNSVTKAFLLAVKRFKKRTKTR